MLNVALGVAVLVATAGVAFAVGRTTAPAAASADGRRRRRRFFTNGGPSGSFDPNGALGAPATATASGFGRFGLAAPRRSRAPSTRSPPTRSRSGPRPATRSRSASNSSTTYHQQADASASDVQPGKTVILQLAGGFRPGGNGNGNGERQREQRQREQRQRERERLDQPRDRQRRDRRSLIEDPRSPCTCSWSRTTSGSPAP